MRDLELPRAEEERVRLISPINGEVMAERSYAEPERLREAMRAAREGQVAWRKVPLAERVRACEAAVAAMVAMEAEIVPELARQMGRPVRYGGGELRGFQERAKYMSGIAAEALADLVVERSGRAERWISREPLGLVLAIAPWNYPFLTAVNTVIPALIAGNAVILKHATQTLLVGERFERAFAAAGLPEGVFQNLLFDHGQAEALIAAGVFDQVNFTGSTGGGKRVLRAASGTMTGVSLELGGKDPAYVRADADLGFAVENLVDGAFFNSGQSCCGIERIYVDRKVFAAFVEGFVALTRGYVLGNPLEEGTSLGPLVRREAADLVRGQIEEAVAKGARRLVEPGFFARDEVGTAYMGPQVLVDVTHEMSVMREESFGPVVGIMAVDSEEEAIGLMNDSEYGLTASIWSRDVEAAKRMGRELVCGTVFMNRCDYLDPALAWTGMKWSGRGATLSRVGFEYLTRPKSFHFREV